MSSADSSHDIGPEDALSKTQAVPVLPQALPVYGLSSGINQVRIDHLVTSGILPDCAVPSGPSAFAVTANARRLAHSLPVGFNIVSAPRAR
jgi:hypothetical protein